MLPAEWLGENIRLILAQAKAEQAVIVDDFDGLLPLAAEIQRDGGGSASGDWIYVPFDSLAVIIGYTGTDTSITVPDQVNGLDVIGLTDGVFSGLRVVSVMIPGNVMAMGSSALPVGAAVKGYNGTYAQTWARRNGHAFENASRFDFRTGVVDMTGIRSENFVRVSAEEIWLRDLEAKRLAEGKRFFLLDENNPYQISYYSIYNERTYNFGQRL